MRILHVITGLGTGGAEMMLLKLLKATSGSCTAQQVISMTGMGSIGARIVESGVEVHSLGMQRGMISMNGAWRFRRLLTQFSPSVVVSWMYHANTLALLTRARVGPPPLIWNIRHSLHDIARERPLTRVVIRLGAITSRVPACILYNSARSAEQHADIGYYQGRAEVIPNGFDVEQFKPSESDRAEWSRRLQIPSKAPVIGMIARFHPMKNHALFLDVAARVARTFPRLVVVMAGTDIDERNRELLTAVESRGLRDRVRLVGEVPHTAPLLNLFDIACLTSSWGEGFPNILGEALLCAKPCVATDVGDAPVVVGESGAIVPVERADLFAESVCRLLEMSATERMNLGRTARERVIGCYGIDTVARRYSAKYESVLTRPPTTNLPLRKSGL